MTERPIRGHGMVNASRSTNRETTVVVRWAQGPRSVPMARRCLLGTLDDWGLGAVADSAALVLSGLLANAVRHGRVRCRQIETRFALLPDAVRIEVHDASEERPMMGLPEEGAEGGWGRPLVDVLAERWGVSDRQGPGNLVWAQLRAAVEPEAV
ncbi:ATP-binding protein [Streptomyces sp. NPDC094032]|uniref:ATP-binding protein n=1 Tax=Streptomyces sp. NPDC094032 TaxID=3155308 RepID=UPI0033233421